MLNYMKIYILLFNLQIYERKRTRKIKGFTEEDRQKLIEFYKERLMLWNQHEKNTETEI